MSNYYSALNDAAGGKEPQTFGMSPKESDEYLKYYFAAKLGFEYGRMVGDGLAEAGTRLFQLFFYRMAYVFPGLLVLFLIFDADSWTGYDTKYFIENRLSDNLLALLLQIVFIAIPISVIFYHWYLYLRGLELGNFLLKNNTGKQRMLFYGIGIYTIGISCIGIYILIWSFLTDNMLYSNYKWVFILIFVFITWKLMNFLVEFHWNDYKNKQWATKSRFFKKGMKKAFQDNVKNLTLSEIKSISVDDLDSSARKKKITKLKYIVFVILMLCIVSFHNFNEYQKDMQQLTLEGKNPQRPLVTSEEITLYQDNQQPIGYLKTFIHRDSLFNEIEGTLENGCYYINFEKKPHWVGVNKENREKYKGGWIRMSDMKFGSIEREIYEKRRPKKEEYKIRK